MRHSTRRLPVPRRPAATPGSRFAGFRASILAFAVGLAWQFGLLYSAKLSAFFLAGGWEWAPFAPVTTDPAILVALLSASPPALMVSAALPCAVLLCFSRALLGRYLFGPPRPGRAQDPAWGPEQLPRLAGLAAALALFLLAGGLS